MRGILIGSAVATGIYLVSTAVFGVTGLLRTAEDLLSLLRGGGVFFVLYSCFLWVVKKLRGEGRAKDELPAHFSQQDKRPREAVLREILSESVQTTGFFLAAFAGWKASTGELWTAKGLLNLIEIGGVLFALSIPFSYFLWTVEKRWGAGRA